MIASYIAYTVFCILVLCIFMCILFVCIGQYDKKITYDYPSDFKVWIYRIIIIAICYFCLFYSYSILMKPKRFLSSDEPVLISGNNATYRYYNYFQTDSVDVIVHKPLYMKGIVYSDKVAGCSSDNQRHHDICIKSIDGKYEIDDYHYRQDSEDLPLDEYKKRVGFKKVFFPEERYLLIYFSK